MEPKRHFNAPRDAEFDEGEEVSVDREKKKLRKGGGDDESSSDDDGQFVTVLWRSKVLFGIHSARI